MIKLAIILIGGTLVLGGCTVTASESYGVRSVYRTTPNYYYYNNHYNDRYYRNPSQSWYRGPYQRDYYRHY